MSTTKPGNFYPVTVGHERENEAYSEKELQQEIEKSATDLTDNVVALIRVKLQKKLRTVGENEKPTSQIITLEELSKKPSQVIWLPPDYR